MINLSTVLGNIVKSIVDHPDKVVITEHTEGDEVLLTLTVAEEDVDKFIAAAEAENLEASEEDLNNEYAKLASMYGMEVENIKMYISADMLADDIKNRKALDFIKENVAK